MSFLKKPDEINKKLNKQQQNKCVSCQRESNKHYFSNITRERIITSKIFWKAETPILINKVCIQNKVIMLRDDKKMIIDEKKLVQLFKDHYINIVEHSCGIKPEKVDFNIGSSNQKGVLSSILDKY